MESTGIDLVCSILRGRSEGKADTPHHTFLIFSGVEQEVLRRELGATWCYKAGDMVVAIAKDDAYDAYIPGSLVGEYSRAVLSRVRKDVRREVCRKAMYAVYNYHDLELEGDDAEDLVEAMHYRVESSTLPLTTRDGRVESL